MDGALLTYVEVAVDNKLDAVAAYDDSFEVQYWNEPMAVLTGIPRTRALGTSTLELFPDLPGSAPERALRDALAGSHVVCEAPFFGASDLAIGRGFDWFVSPLLDRGRVVGGVLCARPQVARGGLEKRLEETEQRFRTMADSSPVLLWMSGLDGMCNFFNTSWLAFSGRTLEQERGVGWCEGVHPEDLELCMTTYMRHFSARESFEMEYRLRRHDGVYRWILDRGLPRTDGSGAFAGFIGSCVDITEQKDALQQTQELADELGRTNAYLEKLLYATSHDLREPLRMINNYLGLLGRTLPEMDERATRYMRHAASGARRLRSMVDGLLHVARIRSRVPELRDIDTDALVGDVMDGLRAAIEEAGATIEVTPLPPLRADATAIARVFQNLLSNAIKFRNEAAPRIRISAEARLDDIVFCVEDHGIGFDPEFSTTIFEAFQRLQPREDYEGDGLGLTIANEAVQRHGGRMWAESELGRGARFFFTLPLPPDARR